LTWTRYWAPPENAGSRPWKYTPTPSGRDPTNSIIISEETLAQVNAKYDLRMITALAGTTNRREPFKMKAMLMGEGKVKIAYTIDYFEFKNPHFPDHPFSLRSPIVETIAAPGTLHVDGGIKAYGIFHISADIKGFQKMSPSLIVVHTSRGDHNVHLCPVRVIGEPTNCSD